MQTARDSACMNGQPENTRSHSSHDTMFILQYKSMNFFEKWKETGLQLVGKRRKQVAAKFSRNTQET